MCCLLFVVPCLLFVVRRSRALFVVSILSCFVSHVLSLVSCPLLFGGVRGCLFADVYWLLFIGYCLLFVGLRSVICCLLSLRLFVLFVVSWLVVGLWY